MIQKTKAIVLSRIKYGDTSLIVNCYTESYGVKSYLLKGILKSKRAKLHKAQFQILTQLDIVAYHNSKGKLNSIKEARVLNLYRSLHSNVVKQSIALFLSEILRSALREEEKNETLYRFLTHAFLWLDTHDTYANFHLLFLLQLSKYLGFYPDLTEPTDFFDLQEGRFVQKPVSKYFLSKGKKISFIRLLGTNFDTLSDIKLTAVERSELLEVLLEYYRLHLHTFNTPKSLAVLQSIF